MVVMVEAACHRCGREWDYTGRSDRYGTCPNCKTSVKLHGGSERAEPSDSPEGPDGPEPTAERCPDPSDRTAVVVNGEEQPVPEAVEELASLQDARAESLAELGREAEERAEALEEIERGLEEVASYFQQMIEEAGGDVEYEHVDAGRAIPEALQNMEVPEA